MATAVEPQQQTQAGAPPANQTLKRARQEGAPFATNPGFLATLTSTKAESVRTKDNVIFVATREDKIVDVWAGLVRHGFYSCPVVGKNAAKYYGFIDMLDIVSYIIGHFGQTKLETTSDWWSMVREDEMLTKKTVRDVMTYPLSFRNPFHPVMRGFSLFAAVELLARMPGVHRVPVIDEQRRLYSVITQSHMIRILNKNMEAGHVGEVMNKPVGEMREIKSGRPVITAYYREMAIDAFRRMVSANVTGLAVISDEGKLVGALSARDLKAISTDGRMFWRLYLPVRDFLAKLEDKSRPAGPVFVTRDNTMTHVVRLLVQNNIHRVFVVDGAESMKPVGVIALKDILLEILESADTQPLIIVP